MKKPCEFLGFRSLLPLLWRDFSFCLPRDRWDKKFTMLQVREIYFICKEGGSEDLIARAYPQINKLFQRSILALLHSQTSNNLLLLDNVAFGMVVNDDWKLKFLVLKAKRTYRFMVFKIDEKVRQVIVEKLGGPIQSCKDLTANLLADESCYAIYALI